MKLKNKDILMGKTILTPSQELNIIKDYTENGMGIYPLCEKYKVGKIQRANGYWHGKLRPQKRKIWFYLSK